MKNPWTIMYTNNVSVKRKFLIELGKFDENFVFWGGEDQELGYRFFKGGLKFKLCKEAKVYHQYHETEYKDLDEQRKAIIYNLISFYEKHPDPEVLDYLKAILNTFLIDYGSDTKIIKLGNLCNNNCIFCEFLDRKGNENKTTEQVKKELDIAKMEGKKEIVFTGGEPTTRSDIINLITYTQQLKFENIIIVTNGRMFRYKNFAEKIVGLGVNSFKVLLLGHNAEIHDYLARSEGSFEQTIQGIKNLFEVGANVEVEFILNRLNYKNLVDIINILSDIKIEINFRIPDIIFSSRKKLFFKSGYFVTKYEHIMPHIKKSLEFVEKKNLPISIKIQNYF
jgi:sulfatase maturation enzyme AslB (radical SAM superfamily)